MISQDEASNLLLLPLLRGWAAVYIDDIATRHADLARTMRAINVLGLNDYHFLGIVELPTALVCRAGDLCRIMNDSQDHTRASLYDFLIPLEPDILVP